MFVVDRIYQLLLPGDTGLTWGDLWEQVAREHCIHVEALALTGDRGSSAARHHFWGALRGAGYSYTEISAQLDVSEGSVMGGVKRAARRLGLEPR